LLINRRGKIKAVFVGDAYEIPFDEILERSREAKVRLRGYRLIHTHLRSPSLSHPDLVTLLSERLDLIGVIEVKPEGFAGKLQIAHMLPPNPRGDMWDVREYQDIGRLNTNFDEFIVDLENQIERSYRKFGGTTDKEGVFLVGFSTSSRYEAQDSIGELRELALSADKIVLGKVEQVRKKPDPRYLVGKGKLEEIILRAKHLGADTLVFDVELTPAQVRAISDQTNLGVMDRTQLILEIFASRANSSEGKLQVQLAQHRYMLPRLTGKGIELSQLGGGIGTRGPGEKKLEEQRRMLRKRIEQLEKQIEKIGKRRQSGRKYRKETGIQTVTLIGYTCAGKSTLFNTITKSDVLAEKRLFSTLTPTTRKMMLPSGKTILLTDTVGFIRDLPEELMKAFRATLEELGESTVLVHMVDSSDPQYDSKIESVENILASNGYDEIPTILVFNKIDKITESERLRLKQIYNSPLVSAPDKTTFENFLLTLDAKINHSYDAPEQTETAGIVN